MSELLGDRTHAEQINVGEIQVGLGIEVFVTQVATADDGHAVVHQPQLVVHAPVLQVEVEQSSHRARHPGTAPQLQRVEHADVDIRMDGEGGHFHIEAVTGSVVEQDAHAHATVGSQ
ncbi:hypothetical protein D3C79_737460 [compost metagenome]